MIETVSLFSRRRNIGAFAECGSYYAKRTSADELWDPCYVAACKELDLEFPEARLLPDSSWSLLPSKAIMEKARLKILNDDLDEQIRQ
jgi:hypothetical protein